MSDNTSYLVPLESIFSKMLNSHICVLISVSLMIKDLRNRKDDKLHQVQDLNQAQGWSRIMAIGKY